MLFKGKAGVKKKFKNIHLSPGQVHQNFYLSCYQITCLCQGKDKQALNFLLLRRTLGENICLSCLKFNLSRAPGQVIFLPLQRKTHGFNLCIVISVCWLDIPPIKKVSEYHNNW